ncbi:Secondary metabolism regulator laeA [Colletotrichum fructicola]|nr:Secondary metabolism regulator laeA [Colletotrichum fructicola]
MASTEQNPAAASSAPHSTSIELGTEPIIPHPGFDDDRDSLAGSEFNTAKSTASLTASITEYRKLHGRTYTQKTDYWGPNDEQQNEGLDLAHHWETLLLGDRLFLSPIGDTPGRVLDLGTGTENGDFADDFPTAEVIGVEISPIQPGWAPPNCKFQIDDVEQPWTWSLDFDFIHLRHMEACISNCPAFYKQIYDHLKPGGYFEIKDFDIEFRSGARGDLPEDHIYRRWGKVFFEAANKLGKSMDQSRGGHQIADALRERWFHDQSLEGFSMFLLTQVMGWDSTPAAMFVAEARAALKDPKLQTVIYLQNVYGRKPETVV